MIAPDIQPEEGRYVKSIAEALNLAVLTLIDARAANATLRQRIEQSDIVYLKAGTGRTGQPADIEVTWATCWQKGQPHPGSRARNAYRGGHRPSEAGAGGRSGPPGR